MSNVTIWRIGGHYVNPAHIVSIKFTAAKTYTDTDDDTGEQIVVNSPAKCLITLSSVTSRMESWDNRAGYGEYAITNSDTIAITGAEAETFDNFLGEFSCYPTVPEPEEGAHS